MLLIIFLGLIATLTLVSGDCDLGPPGTDDFNFTEATGPRPWFVLMHSSNDFENNLACVVVYYGCPQGNISLISIRAYQIRENRYVTVNGTITNWNSTGLEQNYPQPLIWNGWHNVIGFDYKRYKILKHCSMESNQTYVYVSYRSTSPDEATKNEVIEKLEENNIEVNHLAKWPGDHCQQAGSSTERESSA